MEKQESGEVALLCLVVPALVLLLTAGCAGQVASLNVGAAERAEKEGDYKKAADICRKTIANSKSPDTVRNVRYLLARLLMERLNQPQEAAQLYETILEAEPSNPESAKAAWILGEYAYANKDWRAARRNLLRVIMDFSGSPHDADARLWLAATYEALIETPAAIDAYYQFLQKYPNDSRVAYARKRGDTLQNYERQDPPTVEELLAAAEEAAKTPPQPTAQTERPSGRRGNQPDPNALRIADGADPRHMFGPPTRPGARQILMSFKPSEIFKQNPKDLMFAGGGLFGGEDLEESLDGSGANLDDALKALGMLYYQLEDFERAGACLERTVELDAEEPEMLAALAVCYMKVNRPDKAKETIARAYKIDATVYPRIYVFAENREAVGNSDEAKQALTLLLGVDSARDAEVRKRIAAVD